MRAFTKLTMQERLSLTTVEMLNDKALWHGLYALRGLAEALLKERELAYMRALPGFDAIDDVERSILSALFLFPQSAGLSQWLSHRALERDALSAREPHLEGLR